jgi:signal transduction histidine kinase
VGAIIDEVRAIYAPLAVARRVRFSIVVGGDTEHALAYLDRHRVVQLLSNIVANAIEATPPGGDVQLEAHADEDCVSFEVSDTGTGITADELRHVFDRFWQAAHRRKAGAGLGLSIARSIAISHGGDIAVESEPGRGTRFAIVLPLEARAPR